MDTLAVRLTVPTIKVRKGLSPSSHPAHHHSEPDSTSHGAARHAWRTKKRPAHAGLRLFQVRTSRPPRRSGQHAVIVGPDVPVLGLGQEEGSNDERHDRTDDGVPSSAITTFLLTFGLLSL